MNFISTCAAWFRNQNAGLLVLRVAIALPFIVHGYAKLADHANTAILFGQIGIFAPAFMAWVTGLVEFVGGIAILLGIFVRTAGVLLAVVMIVAIATVHFKNGYSAMTGGYEYQLTLLLASLAVAFTGAGGYVPAPLAKFEAKCCSGCSDNACGCEETK